MFEPSPRECENQLSREPGVTYFARVFGKFLRRDLRIQVSLDWKINLT